MNWLEHEPQISFPHLRQWWRLLKRPNFDPHKLHSREELSGCHVGSSAAKLELGSDIGMKDKSDATDSRRTRGGSRASARVRR